MHHKNFLTDLLRTASFKFLPLFELYLLPCPEFTAAGCSTTFAFLKNSIILYIKKTQIFLSYALPIIRGWCPLHINILYSLMAETQREELHNIHGGENEFLDKNIRIPVLSLVNVIDKGTGLYFVKTT